MRQDDEKKGQNMVLKVPTRVEWDNENDCVDVLIEDDEEALLLTAQEGYPESGYYHRRTEELFSCLQKLVVASMTIGLIGLGVAFVFLIEYLAGG